VVPGVQAVPVFQAGADHRVAVAPRVVGEQYVLRICDYE
jgi:hypothetical protein